MLSHFSTPVKRRMGNLSLSSTAKALSGLVVLAVALLLPGCREKPQEPAEEGKAGQTPARVIKVWSHQGQEAENLAMRQMVAAFNEAHQGRNIKAEIEFFPDYQYTEKVSSAAAAGDLPDVLDLDGPLLAEFVDADLLQPLDPWVTEEERGDFIRTIIEQGTIDGKLYALGAFDSALVLYYDREMLAKADVTPPPELEAWTWEEFMAACRKLKAAGMDPVSMHMGESADEWFTYAFSPVIWSVGGRLIAEDGVTVEGVLNAPVNVKALEAWQQLFTEDVAAAKPVDPDPFGSGRTAMDWTGHWLAPSHRENKGEALGVMPLPRMGDSIATGCGSWCWGLTASAEDPDAAVKLLKWVTHPEKGVQPMVEANAAVPARKSAFDAFPEYREMPYRLFRYQLEHWARPRPRTPHYATLTQRFASAIRDIALGADVQERLDAAASEIQRLIDQKK